MKVNVTEVLVSVNNSMHSQKFNGNLREMCQGEWSLAPAEIEELDHLLDEGKPVVVTACYHGLALVSYMVEDMSLLKRRNKEERDNKGVFFQLGFELVKMGKSPRKRNTNQRGFVIDRSSKMMVEELEAELV
jgi:hypothetical protein